MLHVHQVIMCNYAMEGIVFDQVSYARFFFYTSSSLRSAACQKCNGELVTIENQYLS